MVDYWDKPEETLVAIVLTRLRVSGYVDVRPSPEIIGDDLAVDLAVESAFGPDMGGLFPALITAAHRTFTETWLDRSGATWPFEIHPDDDDWLGQRVHFTAEAGDRKSLIIATLCVVGAVEQWIETSATRPPVLAIPPGPGEPHA